MSAPAAAVPDLESPVGAVARPDFVRLYASESAGESLRRLRHERLGERIIYFYVTDTGGKLVGVVPTRRLLLADPASRIGDLMLRGVVSIAESTPLMDAIRTLTSRKLLALPVVDADGVLKAVFDIGQCTEQVVDLERREEADRLFQLAGVHIDRGEQVSLVRGFRQRFPWLLCNIGSGLAAAVISQMFDHVLAAVVALAFFFPVVLAVAESVAIQSLTISLQALQLATPVPPQPGGALRQLATGSMIGLAAGLVVGFAGLVWLRMPQLAIVLVGGLVIGAAGGAVIGYLAPRLVHAWNLDPKIASGPASLALADMVSITAYLGLAALLLR
jgi:magnesium transporter